MDVISYWSLGDTPVIGHTHLAYIIVDLDIPTSSKYKDSFTIEFWDRSICSFKENDVI